MAIAKLKLSGGTDGKNIKITTTATAGDTIHTAHASNLDEIWLWATNTSAVDVKVTVEFGGVASPDDLMEFTVPAEDGWHLIVPGLLLSNSLVAKIFAGTANVINVNGYVHQHS